jgi:uncharacterized protein (TIGR03083 family)
VADGSQPSWLDLEPARTTALRELAAFVDLAASLSEDDLSRFTALPGWTVRDLIEHVAGVPGYDYFAGRMRSARLGTKDGPNTNGSVDQTGLAAAELIGVLRQRASEFEAELRLVTEDDLDRLLYIMPGRRQLQRSALGGYVFEFGLHRYDLETALDNTFELAPDVVAGVVLMAEVDGFRTERKEIVPRAAEPGPQEDVSYVLAGDTVRWEFSFTHGVEPYHPLSPTQNGRWEPGTIHGARCTVRGSDSAVCLVLTGRLSTHDALVSATDGFVPRTFMCW